MHSSIPYKIKKTLALLASSCSPLPWFSYYMSGGHERHHKNAGTGIDIDREALFWIWEKTPHPMLDNPPGVCNVMQVSNVFVVAAVVGPDCARVLIRCTPNPTVLLLFVTVNTSSKDPSCGCRSLRYSSL